VTEQERGRVGRMSSDEYATLVMLKLIHPEATITDLLDDPEYWSTQDYLMQFARRHKEPCPE